MKSIIRFLNDHNTDNKTDYVPSIWKKTKKTTAKTIQVCLTSPPVPVLDYTNQRNILTNHNELISLITHAIYSKFEKKMSLQEILGWFHRHHHLKSNEKAIQACLMLNKDVYFENINDYWKVIDTNPMPFNQFVFDTGVHGGFEYWDGHSFIE